MTPIIQSLLDTDLYKFTMLQVMLHQFPQAHSVYEFRCRNETTVYPLADIREDFERELEALCMLRFQDDELDYLRPCVLSKAISSIIWSCFSSNAVSLLIGATRKAV